MVEEWTEIARIVLTRRADLIQIGALKRKKPASKKAKKGDALVAPSVQVVTAPMLALPPGAPQPPRVVAHESAPVTTSTAPS